MRVGVERDSKRPNLHGGEPADPSRAKAVASIVNRLPKRQTIAAKDPCWAGERRAAVIRIALGIAPVAVEAVSLAIEQVLSSIGGRLVAWSVAQLKHIFDHIAHLLRGQLVRTTNRGHIRDPVGFRMTRADTIKNRAFYIADRSVSVQPNGVRQIRRS